MTDEEYEALAVTDFQAVAGKVILVSYLSGYVEGTDDNIDIEFNPPIAVRVDLHTDDACLDHYCMGWLDPYWDVDIIDLSHPQLPPEGLRSPWMYGTSYNVKTGEVQKARYQEVPTFSEGKS